MKLKLEKEPTPASVRKLTHQQFLSRLCEELN